MNSSSVSADQLTPRILITGVTGNVGTELTKRFIQRGIPFRAMVRNPTQATALTNLPGVDVVAGDFNDPSTLAAVLTGIERAFLLTPSSEQTEQQQLRFVAEAPMPF